AAHRDDHRPGGVGGRQGAEGGGVGAAGEGDGEVADRGVLGAGPLGDGQRGGRARNRHPGQRAAGGHMGQAPAGGARRVERPGEGDQDLVDAAVVVIVGHLGAQDRPQRGGRGGGRGRRPGRGGGRGAGRRRRAQVGGTADHHAGGGRVGGRPEGHRPLVPPGHRHLDE